MQRTGMARSSCDDAEFFAMLSEHPTRQEIQRASTPAQLAAVADRLLAWQEELVLREHELIVRRSSPTIGSTCGPNAGASSQPSSDDFEADFTLIGSHPKANSSESEAASRLSAAADAEAAAAVAPVVKGNGPNIGKGDDDDGFFMVGCCSSEDMAAAVRDALRPAGMVEHTAPKSTLKKKPFMCSEDGCMRIVVHADDALHKCAGCGHIFCSEHSSRLSVIFEKPSSSVFAPRPPDGGARSEVSVAIALCENCLERRKFHPGTTCDKTATFFAMRAVALNKLAGELNEWKQAVSPAATAMVSASGGPNGGGAGSGTAGAGGDPNGIGRFLSNIVLTAKDTWTTCAGCGMYFDRLTVKHTCVLCKRVFCSQCGLVSSTMSTVMLLHILGLDKLMQKSPSGSTPPMRLDLKVCHRCDYFYKRMRREITLPLDCEPPLWIERYEECQRIADGCAQTLALVTNVPPDEENALGLSPTDQSAPRLERMPNDQASQRLCESVSAMMVELEEACSWLSNLANAAASGRDPMDDPPTRTEITLLKNIRRRFMNNLSSSKAQLVSVRTQLALESKQKQLKEQQRHIRSASAAAAPSSSSMSSVPHHAPSASQSVSMQRSRQGIAPSAHSQPQRSSQPPQRRA